MHDDSESKLPNCRTFPPNYILKTHRTLSSNNIKDVWLTSSLFDIQSRR